MAESALNVAKKYVCPKCNALPGENCTMPSGRETATHNLRLREMSEDDWNKCSLECQSFY